MTKENILGVFVKKLETDEQESKQELQENLSEQFASDRELAQYEVLKKKFRG